ncbi:MAG: hypothetical protein KDE27_09860 [Planctomycetes bacterium]|nr:hypothetical protein [Planctomycetota bacterium]
MHCRPLRLALLVTPLIAGLLVAPAGAQTTHLVGPGGFATIGDAVAAAVDGDIVHVAPGTYPRVSINKALTVRALTPGTVVLENGPFLSGIAAPAGKAIHVIGLEYRGFTITNGSVTLDQCTFVSNGDILVAVGGRCHMQDCMVLGRGPAIINPNAALVVDHAFVSAIGSTFEGTSATGGYNGVSVGVDVRVGTFQASGCTIQGGNGPTSRPGLIADAESTIWLSDSNVISDPAVCPIEAASAHGRQARTTLTPNCGALPSGPLLGIRRTAPMTPGGTLDLAFLSEPNEPIGVFANLLIGFQPGVLFEQPNLLGGGCQPVGMLFTDATGNASASWSIPLVSALVDRGVWVQGFAGLSAPIRTSSLAGGVVR